MDPRARSRELPRAAWRHSKTERRRGQMTTQRAESRMVSVPLQTLRWPPHTTSSDAAPRWRSVRKPHVYKRAGRKRSAIRQPCAAPAIKHRSPGDAGCTLGRDAYQTRLDARPLGPTNSRNVPTVDFACSRRPQAHRALLPSRPAVRHGFGHRCRPKPPRTHSAVSNNLPQVHPRKHFGEPDSAKRPQPGRRNSDCVYSDT